MLAFSQFFNNETWQLLFGLAEVFLALSNFIRHTLTNIFFRCYRPSLNKSNFFVHSTHHKFYYGNFGYLGLDFRLKIRKLWLKRWFCTVCQKYVFLCVTWQTKEVLVQNWLLKMLKLFLMSSLFVMRAPEKVSLQHLKFASRQTATIPFEMSHTISVWHLWSCLEYPLGKSNG